MLLYICGACTSLAPGKHASTRKQPRRLVLIECGACTVVCAASIFVQGKHASTRKQPRRLALINIWCIVCAFAKMSEMLCTVLSLLTKGAGNTTEYMMIWSRIWWEHENLSWVDVVVQVHLSCHHRVDPFCKDPMIRLYYMYQIRSCRVVLCRVVSSCSVTPRSPGCVNA